MMDNSSLVQQSEALTTAQGLQPLRLTVTGKRKITLYAAPKPEERDDRVFPHMWVHRLRIRRSKRGLFVLKETWDALPETSTTETTVHEWPAVRPWVGLEPPVTFEKKQTLLRVASSSPQQAFFENQELHDWKADVWSDEMLLQHFRLWKIIRDAEHEDLIFMKREPKWVVNPKIVRPVGYVFAFHTDHGKARVAQIYLELDIATAVYNYATGDFKERVVEEYARPYEPEKQRARKEKLHNSNRGFCMTFVGKDVKEASGVTYIQGPPLREEEFRSSLQNLLEHFRRTRVENRKAKKLEAEIAIYILPAVLEIFLGGAFAFEPRHIIRANSE